MAGLPFAVIPLEFAGIASGNARTENPVDHLGEFLYPGMTWKSAGATNLWARGFFPAASAVDFCGLLATTATAATTARLRLGDSQAEVDGTADYDSGAQVIRTPAITSESGLYHWHWEFTQTTKLWWRIDIGAHTGDFESAFLVLGRKRITARYYEPEWTAGVDDLGGINLGRWGVPEVTDGAILNTLAYRLQWISEAEYEATWRPFERAVGAKNPALYCFDPDASAYRQDRTLFGFNRERQQSQKQGTTRFVKSFDIISLI